MVKVLVFCVLLGFKVGSAKSEPLNASAINNRDAFTSGRGAEKGDVAVSFGGIQNPETLQRKQDNNRLTKKIVPVIQKSFNRYPPYYLFIFIGGFVLFALIRLIDPSYLNSVFGAAINNNLLLSLFKEGIFGFNMTSLLLDLVCICMMGIYIQVFFFSISPDMFLWILGFVAIGYILKLIFIQFLANVFMGRIEALMHLLMHLLLTRMLGLVLLPLLFFALYQPVFNVHELLRIILIAVFVLYMVWLFRLFVKMKSIAAVNIFYLLLYLCTIELSTLAILLRNYIRLG